MFNFVLNYNLFAMSDLNKELESMLGDMGMSVSDSPEPQAEQDTKPQEEQMQFPVQEAVEETVIEETVIEETQQEAAVETMPKQDLKEETPEEDVEAKTLSYLSERLGREVTSFDELLGTQNTPVEINEQVAVINEFVKNTGRSVEDWFAYQAMNPSEMDDLDAVKMQLKTQYGGAASDSDLDLLIENKYSLDEDLYDESEVRLSKLQLKMDAGKARQEIESVRSEYAKPAARVEQAPVADVEESFVSKEWLSNMSAEVDALEGIEFELGKDKSFTFGIEDTYKSNLKSKNENIEDFFGSYVDDKSGNWNFEKWNMHQAVLDNIETIVKTAYSQGLGEGQRGLVDKAANVQYNQPNQSGTLDGNTPNVEEQLRQALGLNDNGLTFKI